jgi:hypothetical protein
MPGLLCCLPLPIPRAAPHTVLALAGSTSRNHGASIDRSRGILGSSSNPGTRARCHRAPSPASERSLHHLCIHPVVVEHLSLLLEVKCYCALLQQRCQRLERGLRLQKLKRMKKEFLVNGGERKSGLRYNGADCVGMVRIYTGARTVNCLGSRRPRHCVSKVLR